MVIFAGLPSIYESEGFDRPHMNLPEQHNQLIEAVCAVHSRVVVVLFNGGPVSMPWVDKPQAILEGYLAGQAGGSAVAQLLLGKRNPCGKLAETFPLTQDHVAADTWFPGNSRRVEYREGLYVGYRYFDSADQAVLFPFGHGLSYTSFSYSALNVTADRETCQVTVSVTNSGEVAGAEVVQVYTSQPEASMYQPQQALKGFKKVMLQPGETQEVVFVLDRRAFACWDIEAQDWVVEAGERVIRVGASSRDIRLTQMIDIASDDSLSNLAQIQGPQIVDGADQGVS